MLTLMNLQVMLEQICCFIHETLFVKVPWVVSVAHDPFVECAIINGNCWENDERCIFQNYWMNLVNTLCFVGANSSWEEVWFPCTLMEDPKSNVPFDVGKRTFVPFDVGKRTFIKLFAFAFISAIYATSLLEFRPALISFWYSQLVHPLWLVIYH